MHHILFLFLLALLALFSSCGSKLSEIEKNTTLRSSQAQYLEEAKASSFLLNCSLHLESSKTKGMNSFSLLTLEPFSVLKGQLLEMAKAVLYDGQNISLNLSLVFAQEMTVKDEDKNTILEILSNTQGTDLNAYLTCTSEDALRPLFFLKKTQKTFLIQESFQELDLSQEDFYTPLEATPFETLRGDEKRNLLNYKITFSNPLALYSFAQQERHLLVSFEFSQDLLDSKKDFAIHLDHKTLSLQRRDDIKREDFKRFSYEKTPWDNLFLVPQNRPICLTLNNQGQLSSFDLSQIFICTKTQDILKTSLELKEEYKVPVPTMSNPNRIDIPSEYRLTPIDELAIDSRLVFDIKFLNSFSTILIKASKDIHTLCREKIFLQKEEYFDWFKIYLDGKLLQKEDLIFTEYKGETILIIHVNKSHREDMISHEVLMKAHRLNIEKPLNCTYDVFVFGP